MKARARCDRPLPRGGKPCFSSLDISPKVRVVAVGQEHRIVPETFVTARRPDQRAVDPGLEILDMAVGPGRAQRRDEMRRALFRRRCAAFVELDLDRLHGAAEILFRPGPARGMNARRAVERIDHKAGIIGESG